MRLIPHSSATPRPKKLTATVLAALAVAFGGLAPNAQALTTKIQPGAAITSAAGQCTLNWIYDGTGAHAGQVFAGTAAHCVQAVGDVVTLQTDTDGDPIVPIGEVAFISPNLDYSLIRVSPGNLGLVDPSLKGHPSIPTGVSTTDTASVGDVVQFSGNGLGWHLTPVTQERRVGILHFNDGTDWSAAGPVTFGDSGGPAADVTDGNKALGIVTVICVGTQCAGAGGVALEGLLEDAASAGFTVALRTV